MPVYSVRFSGVMRLLRFVQFTRAPGRLIEEFKLRVVYIAANPPSPVPEEAEEEDASPRSEAMMDYEAKVSSAFDAVSDNITVLFVLHQKQYHGFSCDHVFLLLLRHLDA